MKEWRGLSSKGAHVILGVAPGAAAVVAAPEIAARHSGPLPVALVPTLVPVVEVAGVRPLAPVPVAEEGHRLR